MPLVYIHGVNVRKNDAYESNQVTRNKLIQNYLLEPLAKKNEGFRTMEIVSPYWGQYGVQFAWNKASVVNVNISDSFDVKTDNAVPSSAVDFLRAVEALSGASGVSFGAPSASGYLKKAAAQDTEQFLEAVIAPIILEEEQLSGKNGHEVGYREANLLIAVDDIAKNPETKVLIQSASSDDELMTKLAEAVKRRYLELLQESAKGKGSKYDISFDLSVLDKVLGQIDELFRRATEAPGRVASVSALALGKTSLADVTARFFGDVFVYLNERRDASQPGPIIQEILRAIKEALDRVKTPDEPLIVITHSMGGNIFYDILTTYAPTLKVDAWISVGGQVGYFEEMKLFKKSDIGIKTPQKVIGMGERVKLWLNVFDPVDILSYQASPIFEGVIDKHFKTGSDVLKAHGAYFKRPSFYHIVFSHLESVLG